MTEPMIEQIETEDFADGLSDEALDQAGPRDGTKYLVVTYGPCAAPDR